MISGGTPTRVMNQPLTAPASAPVASVTTIASSSGSPRFCQATPRMIAHSPMIEPTERSMPPVMMMKVIGRATSPTSAISRPWLSRLPVVRNRSVWVASPSSATTRMTASTISWPIR